MEGAGAEGAGGGPVVEVARDEWMGSEIPKPVSADVGSVALTVMGGMPGRAIGVVTGFAVTAGRADAGTPAKKDNKNIRFARLNTPCRTIMC